MPSVAQLMSVDFVTVSLRMPLDEALALLLESDVCELCVVDDQGRLEGIITDYDLLKASLSGALASRTVADSVGRAIVTIAPDMSLDRVLPLFRDAVCSRAYVCRDRKVVGRLSRMDALRAQAGMSSIPEQAPARRELVRSDVSSSSAQSREELPRAPQFLQKSTSILSNF